jgi:nitrate reductase NapAB chaperone NapD
MKIVFDDKSYIDAQKSDEPGKIIIVISAKDAVNPLKKISNSVELTEEEFKKLISDIL